MPGGWQMGRTFLAAFLLFSFAIQAADAHRQMTPWRKFAQNDQNQCPSGEERDPDGNCTPVYHPGPNFVPGPNDRCWAECECYEGQSPAADNCAPCSYLGMICAR